MPDTADRMDYMQLENKGQHRGTGKSPIELRSTCPNLCRRYNFDLGASPPPNQLRATWISRPLKIKPMDGICAELGAYRKLDDLSFDGLTIIVLGHINLKGFGKLRNVLANRHAWILAQQLLRPVARVKLAKSHRESMQLLHARPSDVGLVFLLRAMRSLEMLWLVPLVHGHALR